MNNKGRIKLVIFVILILSILVLNYQFGWAEWLGDLDNLLRIRDSINNNLLLIFLVYVGVTVVGSVVLALPGVTFALLSGALFGPWFGTFASLTASTLGAGLSFLAGRFFLRDSIKPMLRKNKTLDRMLFSNEGKSYVLLLFITRMVPIFPYNLQNYAYGVTDVGFWKYMTCTFIFMMPGSALYTIGAAGIFAGESRWLYFGIALILAVTVTLIGMKVKKKYVVTEVMEDE